MNEATRRWLAGGTPDAPPRGRRTPNPVVLKIRGYVAFFEGLQALAPRLSPGAVALWCWLWTAAGTAEGKGHRVRTSERRLAARFAAGRGTVRRRLAELQAAGFVELVRRGRYGRYCSVYRVRPRPKRAQDRPATGPGTGP